MTIRGNGKKFEVEEQVRFCDFCNQEISYDKGLDHSVHMTFDFGYFSKRDGDNWEWDACHKCAEAIIPKLEALKKPKDHLGFHGAD